MEEMIADVSPADASNGPIDGPGHDSKIQPPAYEQFASKESREDEPLVQPPPHAWMGGHPVRYQYDEDDISYHPQSLSLDQPTSQNRSDRREGTYMLYAPPQR